MEREILYAICETKHLEFLEKSIEIVRKYDSAINITIYYDENTDLNELKHLKYGPWESFLKPYLRIKYDKREGNRNNDYWKLVALRNSEADVVAYLDADVFIVDWEAFCDGFDIARRWGLALPLNPRSFVEKELEIAADISNYDRSVMKDKPKHMTAYNMGLIFYSKNRNKAMDDLLEDMISEQREHPSRGPMTVIRTMLKSQYYMPYTLPLNWLVCRENVGIEHPITLHVGHKEVMEWWGRDFKDR